MTIDFENVEPFPGAESFARRSKFRLEDFDTLQPARLPWRVKGLWPAVGVCFLGGPSMVGKSFLSLDWLAKVVRGDDVLGRKSNPCGVVYIAAEAAAGVRTRCAGLRGRIGNLGGAFQFIGQAPNLTDPEDIDDLRAILMDEKARQEALGFELGVVCIDTLSAAIPGADENNAKDMSPVLTAVQSLAVELGLVVLIVAHTGKDETRGLRGWSGLLANADGLIMLEDPKGEEIRTGSVVKVKDGKSGDAFAFSLEVVTVGIDDDGDEITTCVVQPEGAPDRPKAGRRATVAQQDAETIRQAFNRIFEKAAQPITAPGAKDAHGVRVGDLRTEALTMGLGPAEPDYMGMEDAERTSARKKWRDHRDKSFNRALATLRSSGLYRIENDWFWAISKNERRPA